MVPPSRQKPYSTEGKSIQDLIRDVRIVWFGLLMGLVMYSVLIALIGDALRKGPEPSPIAVPLAVVLGAMVVGAAVGQVASRRSFIADVRGQAGKLRQEADPLMSVFVPYWGYFVKSHGLIEGAGLFAGLSYMLTGMTASLVVIAGAVLWFLATFPTEDRARRLVLGAMESA